MSAETSAPPGRPTKLNDQITAIIVAAVEAGMPLSAAAASANVSESSLHTWRRRGEAAAPGDEAFTQFSEALTRARAGAIRGALDVIQEAGRGGDWRASAWFLERRFPRLFMPSVTSEMTALIDALKGKLDAETFDAVARVLAEQETARAGEAA